jgi:hypothetical protein
MSGITDSGSAGQYPQPEETHPGSGVLRHLQPCPTNSHGASKQTDILVLKCEQFFTKTS